MLEARQLYIQITKRWEEVYEDTIGVDELRRIVIDIQRDLQARELRAIFSTWTPERLTAAIRDLEGWDGDPNTVESTAEMFAKVTGKETEAQKIRETSAKRVEDIIHNAMANRTRGRPPGSLNKPKQIIADESETPVVEKRGRGRPKGSTSKPEAEKIFRVAKPIDPAKAAWLRDEPAKD